MGPAEECREPENNRKWQVGQKGEKRRKPTEYAGDRFRGKDRIIEPEQGNVPEKNGKRTNEEGQQTTGRRRTGEGAGSKISESETAGREKGNATATENVSGKDRERNEWGPDGNSRENVREQDGQGSRRRKRECAGNSAGKHYGEGPEGNERNGTTGKIRWRKNGKAGNRSRYGATEAGIRKERKKRERHEGRKGSGKNKKIGENEASSPLQGQDGKRQRIRVGGRAAVLSERNARIRGKKNSDGISFGRRILRGNRPLYRRQMELRAADRRSAVSSRRRAVRRKESVQTGRTNAETADGDRTASTMRCSRKRIGECGKNIRCVMQVRSGEDRTEQGREEATRWTDMMMWAGHHMPGETERTKRMNAYDFVALVHSRIKMRV